jgi:hypothetical protein
MFHCPNPDCLRNLKKSRKPFASTQGLSVHLTLSPGCKAFVFQSSASSTSTQHVSTKMHVLNDPTAHIFKKQWLRFNPPRSQVSNFENFDSVPVIEEAMIDDYLSCHPMMILFYPMKNHWWMTMFLLMSLNSSMLLKHHSQMTHHVQVAILLSLRAKNVLHP